MMKFKFPMLPSIPCGRKEFLDDRDRIRETLQNDRYCHLSNTRAGYEKLMKTKMKG